jgi:hypothetical protein
VYECTELPTSTACASRYTVECQSLGYIRRNLADLEDGSRNALDTVDVRAALGFGPLGMDGEEIAGTEAEQQDLLGSATFFVIGVPAWAIFGSLTDRLISGLMELQLR